MGAASSTPGPRRQVVKVQQPQSPAQQTSTSIQSQERVEESKYNDFNFSPGTKSTNRHVGLHNGVGENNCFLNATIQALWHLNLFREKVLYSDQTGGGDNIDLMFPTSSTADSDTLGALCSLFSQYQYTEDKCIPATEIRYILSQLDSSGRFAIGDIADAAETLEALLSHIHNSHVMKLSASSSPSIMTQNDYCHAGSTKCVSHVIFGGIFVSQSSCRSCRATNEPAIIEPFFHYASVLSLLSEASLRHQQGRGRSSFGQLLNVAFRNADVGCPSLDSTRPLSVRSMRPVGGRGVQPSRACTGRAEVELSCLESPMVLAISLAWPSNNVPADMVQSLLDLMDGHVWLSEVFCSGGSGGHQNTDSNGHQQASNTLYQQAGHGGYQQSGVGIQQQAGSVGYQQGGTGGFQHPGNRVHQQGGVGVYQQAGNGVHPQGVGIYQQAGNGVYQQGGIGGYQQTGNGGYQQMTGSVDYQQRTPSAPPAQPAPSGNESEKYLFRGFVCFYGMHYISIFQEWNPHTSHCEYLLFDDSRIRRLGQWESVKEECIRARYQPVLLLYEKQSQAEKENSPAPVYRHMGTSY